MCVGIECGDSAGVVHRKSSRATTGVGASESTAIVVPTALLAGMFFKPAIGHSPGGRAVVHMERFGLVLTIYRPLG